MSDNEFNKPSDQLDQFLSFAKEAAARCATAENEEREVNAATQDILHTLELECHSDEECMMLAIALRDQRRKRRVAKDTVARLSYIAKWYAANQTNAVRAIENVRDATATAEQSLANRSYRWRTTAVQQALHSKAATSPEVDKQANNTQPALSLTGPASPETNRTETAALSIFNLDLSDLDKETPAKKKKKNKAVEKT